MIFPWEAMEVRREKVVVTLLLITIMLSVSSVVVTMNLDTGQPQSSSVIDSGNLNGNVQLVVEEPPMNIIENQE